MALPLCVGASIGRPTSQPALPSIQPIAYFQENCARCHGDYGSNYGDQFARNLDDAKLSKVVDDMCAGPGNAPLSGVDLQAEIAFHRALADRKPFICITKRDGDKFSGETMPGATLKVAKADLKSDVKVDDAGAWSATVPSGSMLEASKDGKLTRLPIDAIPYSHDSAAGTREAGAHGSQSLNQD